MYESVLNYIFNVCMILGFAVPLLNIASGWLGGLVNSGADLDLDIDADFDIDLDLDADMDIGGDVAGGSGHSGAFQFNFMCLCLFLIVFGATGQAVKKFMTSIPVMVILLLACAAVAGACYWLMYKFLVKRLRENNASALSYADLAGRSGEVTLAVSNNSIGTISITDSTGAKISFRAKLDPDLKNHLPDTIRPGEIVLITDVDVDEKLCYISVRPNKFKKI